MKDQLLRLGVIAGQRLAAWCFERLGEVAWTSKDGRTVPLRQMTDEHLQNAIRVVQRRGEDPNGPPILPHLMRERARRQTRGFR